jgi:hypothetical protein
MPPYASSITSDDSFVLIDKEHEIIYVYHGRKSNKMKQAKAIDIANRIKVRSKDGEKREREREIDR